jgi:hypothetical protein
MGPTISLTISLEGRARGVGAAKAALRIESGDGIGLVDRALPFA